jgi:3-isopropylmalate dehydrogenase
MKKPIKVLFLPGDGIGQEVLREVRKVADWFDDMTSLAFNIEEGYIGGTAYDRFGSPYPAETKRQVHASDAVMLGAVGGPEWASVGFECRPEQGLLDLRQDMSVYANFRPVFVFDSMKSTSSLKEEVVDGMDILIVRELAGGLYFGNPRGIEELANGDERGFNTATYDSSEVRAIAEVAFKAAMRGNKRVCSVDKANVLECMRVWRKTVNEVAEKYPEVELTHMYVDNAAMQMVLNPCQFDVMLTPNLIGDVLSDLGAAMSGSLGMLPSASLGHMKDDNYRWALYEPVHGSAPDIAGKNKANPLAAILSFSMLLKHSLNQPQMAKGVVNAVKKVLEDGYRTSDIMKEGEGFTEVSCSEMGTAVVKELGRFVRDDMAA